MLTQTTRKKKKKDNVSGAQRDQKSFSFLHLVRRNKGESTYDLADTGRKMCPYGSKTFRLSTSNSTCNRTKPSTNKRSVSMSIMQNSDTKNSPLPQWKQTRVISGTQNSPSTNMESDRRESVWESWRKNASRVPTWPQKHTDASLKSNADSNKQVWHKFFRQNNDLLHEGRVITGYKQLNNYKS